jgi:hypothetical protein
MEPLGMYPSLQESEHWPPLGMGVLHVPLPPLVGTEPPRVTSLPAPSTGLISVYSANRDEAQSVAQSRNESTLEQILMGTAADYWGRQGAGAWLHRAGYMYIRGAQHVAEHDKSSVHCSVAATPVRL